MPQRIAGLLIIAGALLASCSPAPIYLSTPAEHQQRYQAFGEQVSEGEGRTQAQSPSGEWILLTSQGTASYYGREFHGRKTASGEIFDMNAMTAAHRTLPFGTIVRVTNLRNGKSAKVRINDRGPFVSGRDIDLSYAAAKAIDLISSGSMKVKIEILHLPSDKR